jgi:di/tricarboxylate transporter
MGRARTHEPYQNERSRHGKRAELSSRKEALQAFQRAAELDPSDATAIDNIKLMARQDRLPVPRWARFHALLIGPGLLVALGRRITRRRHFNHLPKPARRETKRWSRREMVSIAMLAMAGISNLGSFAVPLVWGANRNGGWTFLLLVGAFIFLVTANRFRPHPK